MKEPTGAAGWIEFVAKNGAASAIALYLVWQLTAGIASATQVEAVARKLEAHEVAVREHQTALLTVLETQVRLARAICRSVAKSEPARLECDR